MSCRPSSTVTFTAKLVDSSSAPEIPSPGNFTHAMRRSFLWQTCDALLTDGGPAVALQFLKDVRQFVRDEGSDRARNAVGPFLTPAELKELVAGPRGSTAALQAM